jgi:co-chaperonin GroES (HSP10)
MWRRWANFYQNENHPHKNPESVGDFSGLPVMELRVGEIGIDYFHPHWPLAHQYSSTMKIHSPTDYESYLPIGDKVLLVLPRADPEKLVDLGGILVDENTDLRKNPIRETVVTAIGPECKQVAKGDTVLWNKLNGAPHPFGQTNLYFLPENHLICITKKATHSGNGFPYPVDGAPTPDPDRL